MKMGSFAAVAALSMMGGQALAWSDAGHGAIANIAYRHLTPEVRAKVDKLLKTGVEPRYHGLAMMSFWADEVRDSDDGPWHYINIHFRTDGKPVTNDPLDQNVVWAVNRFKARLADESLSAEERAEAFRYLVHFVGDAHQPLHNVARDTDAHPAGDRGGNEFAVVPGNGLPDWNTNLHRVWDSGCGAFALPMRAWEPGADERILDLSKRIEAAYPLLLLEDEAKNLDPDSWAKSGFKIATEFAYTAPEGGTPNRIYVKSGQEICLKRAALAGYRLAAILNKALAD